MAARRTWLHAALLVWVAAVALPPGGGSGGAAAAEEEEAEDRLRRCLADGSCWRRLLGEVVDDANASNASNTTYDLSVNPLMLEFEDADSNVSLGTEADQAGKITLAFYGDMRGIVAGADPANGGVLYGNMAVAVVLKVAMLAFANGLVIEPVAERANVEYQVLWADTCKDKEQTQNASGDGRCAAPYALELMQPLIFGRNAAARAARGYIPPARALIGGQKWTTYVASLAAARKVPNIGHWTSDSALSDKLVYPSFVRTNPTESANFQALVALLQHLSYTSVDAVACDVALERAALTSFTNAAIQAGMITSQFAVKPEQLSGYPPGSPYDYPGEPERSMQKKKHWDSIVSGIKTFNAHVHALLFIGGECPTADISSYLALNGLFGAGHQWVGAPNPRISQYEFEWAFALTVWLPGKYGGAVSEYASVTYFDNFIWSGDTQVAPASARFWDFMAYVGQHQDELLGPQLAGVIPESTFLTPSSSSWQTPWTEYLVDAAFAVLRAINDLVLEVGEGFTNRQLLDKLQTTDFEGITGRVRFDATGDRIQEQVIKQYRMPPGTTKMALGIKGTTVPVALFAEGLTVISPILFKAAGGGLTATPPPDKDLACPVGQRYDRDDGVCRICLPGTYTSRAGMSQCELCVPGSYAPGKGASSCLPCPEGFAAAGAGSTNCTSCLPGWYNDALQQPDCRRCDLGTYSTGGASSCSLCAIGTYADGRGHSECDRCEGLLVTRMVGSVSPSDCLCVAGSYRDAVQRDVCHRCPDGMICDIGADANFFPQVMAGNCTGAGDACAIPVTAPQYMTRKEEPLRAFLCLDAEACPGGPPGTCGALRNSEAVACGRCVAGAHKSRKRCDPCQKGINALGVVLAILACILGLAAIVYAGNRDLILQSNSTFSIVVVCGVTLSAIQTMGVFRSLAVTWFEPLASIFSALMLVGFNFEVLNLECVVQPNAATMYLFRELAGPFALFVLGATVLVKRCWKPDTDALVEFANSAGTIFSALFISIASSCVLPFICYKHPERNGESLLGDPTVLCWDSPDHKITVAIGALTFAVVLCPFIALIAYGTARHHYFSSLSIRGKGRALQAYRFLFYRFQPHAYFYGSMLMLKGLMVCLVPVVIRYDVAFQVCTMSVVLLLSQAVQLQLQPWRTLLANVADGATTAGLILFLVCGSAGSGVAANKESIKLLGTIIFSLLCASLLGGLLVGLMRYLRPAPYYQWFVCHHKRDAGAQARLLKIIFERCGQTVFLDSDDLKNLDNLFDVVKSAIGHLLVYLTRDVLTRPWCAGEIATTVKKGTRMTGICTPDWVPPKDEQIVADALPSYLDLSSTTLHQYSISFEHIASAYRHLLGDSTRKVAAAEGVRGQSRFHGIVAELMGHSKPGEKSDMPRKGGMLVVSSDPGDDEATAAAAILVMMVQEALYSFMREGALMLVDAQVGPEEVREVIRSARAVTVVLTRHSLHSLEQLRIVTYAMSRLRARKEMASSRATSFEVIPLATPSFQFPPGEFYEATLPRLWPPDDEEFVAGEVAAALQLFFKRLAVTFSTHSSAAILQSEAEQLAQRVPRKWQAGGLDDEVMLIQSTATGGTLRTASMQSGQASKDLSGMVPAVTPQDASRDRLPSASPVAAPEPSWFKFEDDEFFPDTDDQMLGANV